MSDSIIGWRNNDRGILTQMFHFLNEKGAVISFEKESLDRRMNGMENHWDVQPILRHQCTSATSYKILLAKMFRFDESMWLFLEIR